LFFKKAAESKERTAVSLIPAAYLRIKSVSHGSEIQFGARRLLAYE